MTFEDIFLPYILLSFLLGHSEGAIYTYSRYNYYYNYYYSQNNGSSGVHSSLDLGAVIGGTIAAGVFMFAVCIAIRCCNKHKQRISPGAVTVIQPKQRSEQGGAHIITQHSPRNAIQYPMQTYVQHPNQQSPGSHYPPQSSMQYPTQSPGQYFSQSQYPPQSPRQYPPQSPRQYPPQSPMQQPSATPFDAAYPPPPSHPPPHPPPSYFESQRKY